MKRVLIVGGANGIGLSIGKILASRDEVERVYIVDKARLKPDYQDDKITSFQFDLTHSDYSIYSGRTYSCIF